MKYTLRVKDDNQRKRKKDPRHERTGARTHTHSLIVGSAERCGENIFKEGERRNEIEATEVLGGFARVQ